MRGVTFDPRGALPLNGAMSPSSGTCHALFMSVTSVFIWAQCTVVDTFSIVAIVNLIVLLLLLLLLFWHFSTVYQQIKMRRVICEHETHHVDAKLDCKPDLKGKVNWELMVLCLRLSFGIWKGLLTILYDLMAYFIIYFRHELQLQWYLKDVEETYIK